MSTIKFEYTNDGVTVISVCNREHLPQIVEAFKDFLFHAGYHHDNIQDIVYDWNSARSEQQAALPQQFDWVDDVAGEKSGGTD